MNPNYNNEYNRSILAQYLRLAQLQKNPKYVHQNWETDIIRNEPWGNYGEYSTVGDSPTFSKKTQNNYKVLSSGGNLAKLSSQKKEPMKIVKPVKKTSFVPKIIIPRPSVPDKTKPYINLTIADLENKKPKPKSGIQLLSRLL